LQIAETYEALARRAADVLWGPLKDKKLRAVPRAGDAGGGSRAARLMS